jgi:hypothetical protein
VPPVRPEETNEFQQKQRLSMNEKTFSDDIRPSRSHLEGVPLFGLWHEL